MTQPALEQDPPNPGTDPQVGTKPWGDDENFDAEKAWKLIQDLRTQKNDPVAARELQELREKAAQFDEAEKAKMSEVDQHKATASEKAAIAEKAVRENAQLRAVIKYGLTEAQAARLRGDTAEEILADGAEFAKELGLSEADPASDPPPAEEKPTKDITSHHRPTQQPEPATPRGGRTPAAEPEEDLSEIIASIPR